MRTIDKYILRQFLVPFGFFAAVLMAVVWLTQAFRMLDLILNRGQDAATFGLFALLITPKVATIVIPIALLCAVLYCINHLRNDSELVVMQSVGMNARTIAGPIIGASIVITVLMFVVSVYLAPQGQRTLRSLVVEVREDLAGAVLQEATFNQPAEGLTVYVRERSSNGDLTGLLVHDSRNPNVPVTYMAERGLFLKTDVSPRIVMQNGRVQRINRKTGEFSNLSFDKYTFDLGQFVSEDVLVSYKPSERTVAELLQPGEFSRDERERNKFMTEIHTRLSGPLYGLAFVFIALTMLLHAKHSRGNLALPIISAITISVLVRLGGFRLTNEINRSPEMALVLYAVLFIAIALPAWRLRRNKPIVNWPKLNPFRRAPKNDEVAA